MRKMKAGQNIISRFVFCAFQWISNSVQFCVEIKIICSKAFRVFILPSFDGLDEFVVFCSIHIMMFRYFDV